MQQGDPRPELVQGVELNDESVGQPSHLTLNEIPHLVPPLLVLLPPAAAPHPPTTATLARRTVHSAPHMPLK